MHGGRLPCIPCEWEGGTVPLCAQEPFFYSLPQPCLFQLVVTVCCSCILQALRAIHFPTNHCLYYYVCEGDQEGDHVTFCLSPAFISTPVPSLLLCMPCLLFLVCVIYHWLLCGEKGVGEHDPIDLCLCYLPLTLRPACILLLPTRRVSLSDVYLLLLPIP